MSKKMSNPPVYYAIVQAQFNPVAAMTNYINEIQDKLRLDGYTLFNSLKVPQLHLEISLPTKAEVRELSIWRITNSDRKSGFILSQSSLAYHTTHYQTHDQFFDTFLLGLKKIHSVIKLEHIDRLGVRYLNAVLPTKNEVVEKYLINGLHGVKVNASPRYSLYESVFDTKIAPSPFIGTLVNRVHCRLGHLGFPPDIAPPDLLPMPNFTTESDTQHAVIDIDHFIEGQMPLRFEEINFQLAFLHGGIKQAFNSTTTDYAKKAWGQ